MAPKVKVGNQAHQTTLFNVAPPKLPAYRVLDRPTHGRRASSGSIKDISPAPAKEPAPVVARVVLSADVPLARAFDNVPPGWKSMFDEARIEIEHAVEVVERLTTEATPRGASRPAILPRANDVLAPFWSVPSPAKVRVLFFFSAPDPTLRNEREVGLVPVTLGLGPSHAENLPLSAEMRLLRKASGNAASMDTNLQHWAEQGVLLLHAAMTTLGGREKNAPSPHLGIWNGFYQHVINAVREDNKKVLVVLCGAPEIMGLEMDPSMILVAGSVYNPGSQASIARALDKVNAIFESRGEPGIDWSGSAPLADSVDGK